MDSKTVLKRIGIALIGIGRAGTIHFKNCLANRRVDIRYLVDYDIEKCHQFIEENFLDETKKLSPDQLKIALDDPKVDGAIIATATSTHEELILKCLEAGKAVFCEKPMAESYDGIDKCYKLAQEVGCPLFCAFNRRFDPTLSKIRDEIRAGKIGQIQVVKTCSRDFPFPSIDYLKSSPGIYHDCAIHDIDLVMWLLGEKPVLVSAFGHAFHEEVAKINDVDTTIISLKFPSGILAVLELRRYSCYGYDQRLEVHGSGGMLQSKNRSASAVSISDANGISDDLLETSFTTRYADSYKRELEHFLESFSGCDLMVKGDETLAACKVAQACSESNKSGMPVNLQWNKKSLIFHS